MSDILEPNFNGLPKPTDWKKVIVPLQQANEKEFRGATLLELGDNLNIEMSINAQRVPAVPPGALVAGPADREVFMEIKEPGSWTWGANPPLTNAPGNISTFYWDKTDWKKNDSTALPTVTGVDKINPIGDLIPKEKAVAEYAVSKKTLGITDFTQGNNVYTFLDITKINDLEIWDKGYLRNDGSFTSSENWRSTKAFYKIIPGSYFCNIGLTGNTAICIYDANKEIVSSYTVVGAYSGNVIWNIVIPENGRFIKLTRYTQSGAATASYYVKPSQNYGSIIQSEYFLTKDNIDPEFDKRGFKKIPEGTNAASSLTNSDLNNTDLWHQGFLHYNGKKNTTETSYRYSNPIPIYPISYRLSAAFGGNSRLWVLDQEGNITRQIQNNSGATILEQEIKFLEGESFFQFSQVIPSNTKVTELVQLEDYSYIEGIEAKIDLAAEVESNMTSKAPTSKATASGIISALFSSSNKYKTKFPVISFISDDGHQANWEWYLPLLDSKGVKSTFAIITGRMGTNPSYATADQVKELFSNGHDIAGHSENHLQTGTLPIAEQEEEIKINKLKLMSLIGVDNCNIFVAPFANRTIDTDRIIRKYFDCDFLSIPIGTISAGTCCNEPPIDSFMLKRVNFDAVSLDQKEHLKLMKQAVDVCLANNQWLSFCIHPQYPEYSQVENIEGWQRRRQDLADLIDYIKSLNIPIATAREALYLWRNTLELGTQRLEKNYYVVGMNGAPEGDFFKK